MKIKDAFKSLGTYLASRPRKRPVTTVVLHATAGGTFLGAWSTLKLKGYGYHALFPAERDKDHGWVIKCVPDSRTCAHAGKSVGPDGPSVNAYSLGASLVNMNDGKDPYSDEQYQASIERVASWVMAYPTIKWITTHYWVSPGRKTDPKGFDMSRFMRGLRVQLESLGVPESRIAEVTIWKP